MVEYAYPECTASCLSALAYFHHKEDSNYRSSAIRSAIARAVKFLERAQQPDGAWFGSWAICFTYATFLALMGLAAVGQTYETSVRVRKACHFLLRVQLRENEGDGNAGWGEHYTSCELQRYVQHPAGAQIVQTAWATLALMYARCPDRKAIRKGLQVIKKRQDATTGEWPQEDVEGVFNRTCMIGYPNYKYYFSVWTLGKFETTYEPWWKEVHGKK